MAKECPEHKDEVCLLHQDVCRRVDELEMRHREHTQLSAHPGLETKILSVQTTAVRNGGDIGELFRSLAKIREDITKHMVDKWPKSAIAIAGFLCAALGTAVGALVSTLLQLYKQRL